MTTPSKSKDLAEALLEAGRQLNKLADELQKHVARRIWWVHTPRCGGYCDYACGALFVEADQAGDGTVIPVRVGNGGTLQVTL